VTDPEELLDMRAAAAYLGLAYDSVRRYRAADNFPPEDAKFGQSPAWLPSTLDTWKTARPGRTGRPRKDTTMTIDLTPRPGYAHAADLLEAAGALAAHLNTLTSDQVSESYANGVLPADEDGNLWAPAPEGWVEADGEGRYFVASTGAAARNISGQWVPVDPGSDVLSDQGLALWGTEGFGYPVQD
jgi:predicted DNA-binding transcriptional regulator AlpA